MVSVLDSAENQFPAEMLENAAESSFGLTVLDGIIEGTCCSRNKNWLLPQCLSQVLDFWEELGSRTHLLSA